MTNKVLELARMFGAVTASGVLFSYTGIESFFDAAAHDGLMKIELGHCKRNLAQADECAHRREIALLAKDREIQALVAERDRYKALAGELAEALQLFANFACDTPHVGEPECSNCIARTALAKHEQEVRENG